MVAAADGHMPGRKFPSLGVLLDLAQPYILHEIHTGAAQLLFAT